MDSNVGCGKPPSVVVKGEARVTAWRSDVDDLFLWVAGSSRDVQCSHVTSSMHFSIDFNFIPLESLLFKETPDHSRASSRAPPEAPHLAPPRPSLRRSLTPPLPPDLAAMEAGPATKQWSGGGRWRPVAEVLGR
jgi:hypothetical protein